MANLGTWWRKVEGLFLYLYTLLVIYTSRFEVSGEANVEVARASGRPLIWTLWHGLNLPFVVYGFKNHVHSSYTVVIVGDERGEVLAELSRRLGAETVGIDMAGNPVASGRTLLNVIKKLKNGQQTFLCPDGPDGPAYVPKKGIFFLAEKARANIIPWGCWTKHAYLRKRWDNFVVPLPFARIYVSIGEPIQVDRGVDEAVLQEKVVAALHQVRDEAMRAAGVTPWR